MTELRTILFLCTGNSARSILAESLTNHVGKGRFQAFSAGSHPAGVVNPLALETLREAGLPVESLRSKSWDEFAVPEAPRMDFIITVCDNAAGEICPIWPGQPMTAHWGVTDPAAVQGPMEERMAAFARTATILRRRIELFASLRTEALDRLALQRELERIGSA